MTPICKLVKVEDRFFIFIYFFNILERISHNPKKLIENQQVIIILISIKNEFCQVISPYLDKE